MRNRPPGFAEMLAAARSHGRNSRWPEWWDGLVGYWPLAEGAGLVAHDLSGYSYNGTIENMAPGSDWVTGKNGHLLDFDGVDDRVVFSYDNGSGPLHDACSHRTISVWFSVTDGVTGPNVLYEEGGNTTGLAIGYRTTPDTIIFLTRASGSFIEIASVDTVAPDETLHHALAIYSAGTMQLYLDGKYQSTNTNGTSLASKTGGVGLGDAEISPGSGPMSGNPWKGTIGSTAAWNRVLTPSEIQRAYCDPHAMGTLRSRVWPAVTAADIPSYYYAQEQAAAL